MGKNCGLLARGFMRRNNNSLSIRQTTATKPRNYAVFLRGIIITSVRLRPSIQGDGTEGRSAE